MGLFESVTKSVLNEDFEKGGFYVYHGTRTSAESGIADKGFERFYTSSNGGNMYGPGLYTTYKLSTQGQNARGVYGSLMYKLKVKSLRNFVIYDRDIAMKVYGTDSIEQQLQKILPPLSFMKLKQYWNYDKIINSRGDNITSVCALELVGYFRNNDREGDYKVAGYIFSGNHDGWVCFIKDFKNAYPVEVSRDCGQTWQPFKGGKHIQEFGIDDVDLRYQLGKNNYALMQELDDVPFYFINGFAKVKKAGKYNFLYRKKPLKDGVISPVWFDYAPETFTNRGTCTVVINGDTFILKLDDKTNQFNVYLSDGKYLCKLNVLDRIIDNMSNTEDDFDEEF